MLACYTIGAVDIKFISMWCAFIFFIDYIIKSILTVRTQGVRFSIWDLGHHYTGHSIAKNRFTLLQCTIIILDLHLLHPVVFLFCLPTLLQSHRCDDAEYYFIKIDVLIGIDNTDKTTHFATVF